MAIPKNESKGIESIKNLDHMSDTELFDNIVELWEVYGNGLDLEEFIEIYNEYLTDKDMNTECFICRLYDNFLFNLSR